jgi:hypothetical protein
MDSVQEEVGTLVVLVRTAGSVFAVTREDGDLVYMRLRTGTEPCPLDQSAAIALLREGR